MSLFRNVLIIFMFLLAFPAMAQEPSAQEMAEEATGLYRAALQVNNLTEQGRLFFLVSQKLQTIRSRFPKSSISAQIGLGRYRDIDVTRADREGRLWRDANPTATIGATNLAPVPSFGQSAKPKPAPLAPNFGPAPADANTSGNPAKSILLSKTDTIERLRATVVIVYVQKKTGNSFGTGFFISPTHLLTNSHVVEGADRVVIGNKLIGLRAATVISRGMTSDGKGMDSAVLEVENFRHSTALTFAINTLEGQVIAIGGYPGTAMDKDQAAQRFFALLRENRLPTQDSFPNVRFDFGTVQGIFIKEDTGIENIQTGVTSAKGNSGSPYVNECGQVVGQEYSGSVAQLKVYNGVAIGMAVNFNWALSGRELVKFASASRIPINVAAEPCR